MKFIPMRELKINPSKVLDRLAKEKDGFIVTRNGKPAAALTYLDEDLLDDFIIAHHPTLRKELKEALAEYEEKGGVDLDTLIEQLERRSRSSRSGRQRCPDDSAKGHATRG